MARSCSPRSGGDVEYRSAKVRFGSSAVLANWSPAVVEGFQLPAPARGFRRRGVSTGDELRAYHCLLLGILIGRWWAGWGRDRSGYSPCWHLLHCLTQSIRCNNYLLPIGRLSLTALKQPDLMVVNRLGKGSFGLSAVLTSLPLFDAIDSVK